MTELLNQFTTFLIPFAPYTAAFMVMFLALALVGALVESAKRNQAKRVSKAIALYGVLDTFASIAEACELSDDVKGYYKAMNAIKLIKAIQEELYK